MSRLPGIVAAVAVMLAGFALAEGLGRALLAARGLPPGPSPISVVPIVILLGLVLRNLLPLPESLAPGLKFCTTAVLRAGIVLVGIKLSLFEMLRLGLAGIPVVVAAIAAGLLFVPWLNRRLGLPPRLGMLIAAGTSICGVTAIVSTAPAIEADEREVAYAVANIVAFGLCGMLVYPYLAHALLHDSATIGLFLGTAIHDTSQVVGAALTYKQVFGDDAVLRVATVTKLTRNLFLAGVIPYLAWQHARAGGMNRGPGTPAASWRTYVPAFIFGFIAMAIVRSIGDGMLDQGGRAWGVWDRAAWSAVATTLGDTIGARWLLGTAMAAVGLGTSFSVFQSVGLRPFAVGLAGALVVGAVGMAMALLLGRYIAI